MAGAAAGGISGELSGRPSPLFLLTIGHSNRSLDDFLALLKAHAVAKLVDVRSVPRSRHNPQFNRESLPAALALADIEYFHMPGLGGLRRARKDSVNTGWKNLSFRGYADYMQTAEFEASLAELRNAAEKAVLAIMCAEAVPWRCHRSLIADVLSARSADVLHIMNAHAAIPHTITSFAVIDGPHVSYPPDALELF